MISVETAQALREAMERAEVPWTPGAGDRFLVPDRGFEDPFIVSEMVIEVRDLPTGRLIRFNGTTEWALDSLPADEVLGIPVEHQLRALLGSTGSRPWRRCRAKSRGTPSSSPTAHDTSTSTPSAPTPTRSWPLSNAGAGGS